MSGCASVLTRALGTDFRPRTHVSSTQPSPQSENLSLRWLLLYYVPETIVYATHVSKTTGQNINNCLRLTYSLPLPERICILCAYKAHLYVNENYTYQTHVHVYVYIMVVCTHVCTCGGWRKMSDVFIYSSLPYSPQINCLCPNWGYNSLQQLYSDFYVRCQGLELSSSGLRSNCS